MADPRTCEHVGLRARVGVRAQAAGAATLRCLFCRQPVTDHPLRRVFACPGCGVLVHGLCARELEGDRCPTLGCAAWPPWLPGAGALDAHRTAWGVADPHEPTTDAARSARAGPAWSRRRLGGLALAAGLVCLVVAALTPREPLATTGIGHPARSARGPVVPDLGTPGLGTPDLGPACRDPDIERVARAPRPAPVAEPAASSPARDPAAPDPPGPAPLRPAQPERIADAGLAARPGSLSSLAPRSPADATGPAPRPADLTGWIAVTRVRQLRAEDQRACLLHASPAGQPGGALVVASARVWWVISEELSQVALTSQWAAEPEPPSALIEVPAGTFRCWRRVRPWALPGGVSVPAEAWCAPGLDVPVKFSLTWVPTPGAAPCRLEGELVRLLPPG